MAREILRGCAYHVGGADLTSQTNRVDVESTVTAMPVTTFGSGGEEELIGGLEKVTVSAGGFVDFGHAWDAEREAYSNRRALMAHTVGLSNSGSAVAARAIVLKALRTNMKFFTEVGNPLPWDVSASGSSKLGYGNYLVSPSSAISTTADGTAVEVGAVPAGKHALATLHVIATTGSPTLDVTIESDDTADFDGSETTRLTFSQATAVGDQFRSVAGPITDTYWRAVLTFGGTGSITVVVAVGISLFAR